MLDDRLSPLNPVPGVRQGVLIGRSGGAENGGGGFDVRARNEHAARFRGAVHFRNAVFFRHSAILENQFRVQGEPLSHLVVNLPVAETFHVRCDDEIRHPLGHALRRIRSHGDDAQFGDSAVADVSLLPVCEPVVPVAHGGRPNAGVGAVVGDDVVRTAGFLRHSDGQVEVVGPPEMLSGNALSGLDS